MICGKTTLKVGSMIYSNPLHLALAAEVPSATIKCKRHTFMSTFFILKGVLGVYSLADRLVKLKYTKSTQ